jgi:hypothetical protein
LEDLSVDGRIILKCNFGKWVGGVDWIDPAQDRESWWAVVKAVNVLSVSINFGEFFD